MEFGWINLFGAILVILILVPNVVYALRNRKNGKAEETDIPRYLLMCEQIGRYGCIVLMWLPLFVGKFGFGSAEAFIAYLVLNAVLILVYYALWTAYFKKKTLNVGMGLAVIPTAVFFFSGLLLHHPSLVVAAVLFGFSHGRITYLSHKKYR